MLYTTKFSYILCGTNSSQMHNWEANSAILPMMQKSEEGKRDLRERNLLKQSKHQESTNQTKNKKPCLESTVNLLLLSSSFFYQVHKSP
jgi:hypothetical protein